MVTLKLEGYCRVGSIPSMNQSEIEPDCKVRGGRGSPVHLFSYFKFLFQKNFLAIADELNRNNFPVKALYFNALLINKYARSLFLKLPFFIRGSADYVIISGVNFMIVSFR